MYIFTFYAFYFQCSFFFLILYGFIDLRRNLSYRIQAFLIIYYPLKSCLHNDLYIPYLDNPTTFFSPKFYPYATGLCIFNLPSVFKFTWNISPVILFQLKSDSLLIYQIPFSKGDFTSSLVHSISWWGAGVIFILIPQDLFQVINFHFIKSSALFNFFAMYL